MSLSILNSISSLTAEHAMSNTQAALQKTLTRLSTGLKINTGADDAAGLSIVNGMQANIAALTQSQQNASNSIGVLQTADGALSQVSSLLNRAVTLATEAANSGITSSQSAALQKEYQSIMDEIDQIGTNTNFNGTNVFSTAAETVETGSVTGLSGTTSLATGNSITITTNSGADTYTYTTVAGDTVQDMLNAINANVGGVSASLNTDGSLVITTSSDDTIDVPTNTITEVGTITESTTDAVTNSQVAFLSDGTSTINTTITTSMGAISSATLGLTGNDLTTSAGAQAVLQALVSTDGAINTVAAERGNIGASINRLSAASNVMANQVINLQSANNALENADIGETVADMTQYNILQSTGMSALQQSNQAQQAILKLIQ